MKIDVPDAFAAKFALFAKAERVLRDRYKNGDGVSRFQIGKCFAAFAAIDSCWRDPAFLVWAGSKGIVTNAGWFDRWRDPAAPSALLTDQELKELIGDDDELAD